MAHGVQEEFLDESNLSRLTNSDKLHVIVHVFRRENLGNELKITDKIADRPSSLGGKHNASMINAIAMECEEIVIVRE